MENAQQKNPKNEANGLMVMAVVFGLILFLGLVTMVWMAITFANYRNNDVNRLKAKEEESRIATTQKLEAQFAELEKTPYQQFVGPEDLGRVAFSYPKTWNQYINKAAQPFEVFFNPNLVRPVSDANSRYALRMLIEPNDYVKVVDKYSSLIKNNKLKQSIININGQQSTRLDGQFSDKITGSAVIFKIRDKTVTIRTDTDQTHLPDFNKLIGTITFKD